MPIDYLAERQNGATLLFDSHNDRLLFVGPDFDGDLTYAEDDDEGVLAVYPLVAETLLEQVLDELAGAGVDVDALLRRIARIGEE